MALWNTDRNRPFPQPVQALLLDLDGTLFDSEWIYLESWKRAEKEFGFSNSEPMFQALRGVTSADMPPVYLDFFGDDELARRVYSFRKEESRRLWKENRFLPKRGAKAMLQELAALGFPHAIATSSRRDHLDRLFSEASMENLVDIVITGDMVTRGKPHPDIFLLAATKLGVDIQHCVVVEDSLPGLQAAAASGAYAVLVPDLLPPTAEQLKIADLVVDDLTALWQAIVSNLIEKR